ncbi:hypothetical protein RA19_18395 [Leisingera sp. ANG-M1]|nr:hypothetical protein RA19_18395 [Leisingera sp. ANG-M1]
MPSVIHDIGGLEVYAWSSTVFVITSILAAALSSQLLAHAGANRAYAIASLVFSVGTLACATAPDIWVLILGRAVQGLGGGFFYALAYAVIRLVYPARLWPLAIGLITVMWGIATLTGPAIGGVFAEHQAWRAAFWVLIPVSCALGALAFTIMPTHTASGPQEGMPMLQLALLIGIILILSLGSVGATPAKALISVATAAALGVILLRFERHAAARLLPRGSWSPKSALGAHYICIALLLIGMQPELFVPYLLQALHGLSPLWAGYAGALMALGWTLGSITSVSWPAPMAARTLVFGPVFGLSGLLLQAVFVPQAHMPWALIPICIGLTAVGFGIGLAWPHIVPRIYQRAAEGEQDLAAAGVTTMQLFSTALGAALGGMVVNLAGLTGQDSTTGAATAALYLFLSFALAPLFCIAAAKRALAE